MRRILLTTAILALVASGCGADPKVAGSKRSLFPSLREEGPLLAVVAAERSTAFASYDGEGEIPSLRPGEDSRGVIDGTDPRFQGGARYDLWALRLSEPAEVSVSMVSAELDGTLSIHAGEPGRLGTLVALGGARSGSPARVSAPLEAGAYTILAGGASPADTGAYTLSAEAPATRIEGLPTLASGGALAGELTPSDASFADGSRYDAWSFRGTAGERLTVTMRSSEVDAFLLLFAGGVSEGRLLAEDDDGGGGRDARVSVTLPESGAYTLVAGSSADLETGPYELSVRVDVAPTIHYDNAGLSSERYALLVGIGDYPGEGNDLRGAVDDARAMQDLLVDRFGFDERNVVVLTDAEATRENIANGIVQHLGQAGPDGMAVFFFSGHGMHTEDIGLVGPLDPDPTGDRALYVRGYAGEGSVLLEEELDYLVEGLGAGRSLVILDAGFQGGSDVGGDGALRSKGVDANDPEVASALRLPVNFIAAEPAVAAGLATATPAPVLPFAFPAVTAGPGAGRTVVWYPSADGSPAWEIGGDGWEGAFSRPLARLLSAADSATTLAEVGAAVAAEVGGRLARYRTGAQEPRMLGGDPTATVEAFFRRR